MLDIHSTVFIRCVMLQQLTSAYVESHGGICDSHEARQPIRRVNLHATLEGTDVPVSYAKRNPKRKKTLLWEAAFIVYFAKPVFLKKKHALGRAE